MATGDLKNNLRKLQSIMKSVHYEAEMDVDSLSKGICNAYLPLYHYILVDYSRHIAGEISKLDIELLGKTDLRFMEALYKVMRELFSYKPPITKDQFFSNGFVERKIIMCIEIVQLVKERHRRSAPRHVKSRPGTGTAPNKLGPRPGSSSVTSKKTSAAKEVSVIANVGEIGKFSSKEAPCVPSVQAVVKPGRVAFGPLPIEKNLSYDPSSYDDTDSNQGIVSLGASKLPLNIQVIKETKTNIQQSKDRAASNPVPEWNSRHTERPTDYKDDHNEYSTGTAAAPNVPQTGDILQLIDQKVSLLVSRLDGMESRMRNVEQVVSVLQQSQQSEKNPPTHECTLSEAQLSTLLARITVLESGMMLSRADVPVTNHATLNDFSEPDDLTDGMQDINRTSERDDQQIYEEVPRIIENVPVDEQPPTNPSDVLNRIPPVVDQTHRIAQMLYDTEDLLQIHVDTPSRKTRGLTASRE